jgi:hypothetical protein
MRAASADKLSTSEALVLAVMVVPLLAWLTRLINLDFWYDEVFTLTNFVLVPISKTLTDYSFPNNHVLFSLLSNLYLRMVGINELGSLLDHPWILRLLPLCFSLGALTYVYLTGRRFLGQLPAQISLAILVTTIPFYNFAVQIRGFSLSFLLVSALFYHTLCYEQNGRRPHALVTVLASALALYAIPLNLYFIATLGAWFLFSGTTRNQLPKLRKRRLFLAGLLALGTGLAVLFYAPMLRSVIDNRFVRSHGLFNSSTITSVMPQVLNYLVSLRYLLLVLAAIGVLVALRNRRSRSPGSDRMLFMLLVLVLGPFLLSFTRGDLPFLRVFMNLAPVFALLLGTVVARSIGPVPWLRSRGWLVVLVVVGYCNATFWLGLDRVSKHIRTDIEVGRKSQDIFYNYYQAFYRPMAIVTLLKDQVTRRPAPVVCLDFDQAALPEYLRHAGIEWNPPEALGPALSQYPSVYVVTAFPNLFLEQMKIHFPQFTITQLNHIPDFHNAFRLTRTGP